jgi:hypothetical protein
LANIVLINRILHRYPVITKDLETWEKDMLEVQDYLSNKHREVILMPSKAEI